jgi:hypothetical protein
MAGLPTTRAFELVDPREPTLPRFIGHGSGDCPWWQRWTHRELDGSKLAGWMRDLDAAGILPVESHRWLPRSPMERHDANRLARLRIQAVSTWAGTWPALPDFLLVEHFGRPHAPNKTPMPVVRLHGDGRAERYASVTQAARARGWTFEAIRHFLETGHADEAGSRYFMARV